MLSLLLLKPTLLILMTKTLKCWLTRKQSISLASEQLSANNQNVLLLLTKSPQKLTFTASSAHLGSWAKIKLHFYTSGKTQTRLKDFKKISACWIWFGGCITIFGDWDRHNQIVYSISYLIKAFTESKVRNVMDLFWIQDGIIILLKSAPYLMKYTFIITSPLVVVTIIARHKNGISSNAHVQCAKRWWNCQ